MPSRFFYWRTADGYLEKNWEADGISAPPFQSSTTECAENGFLVDTDECDPWSKCDDASDTLLPDMDSFAAQPIDVTSDKMLLDNAPQKKEDAFLSIPALHDFRSGSTESITREPNQDRVRRLYRGHSLTLSKIRELRDIAMPHYAFPNASRLEEVESCRLLELETEARSKKRSLSTGSKGAEAGDLRQTRKQQGHNAIEKRYRSNLSDKIYALQQRVPSFCTVPEGVQAGANAREGESSVLEAGQKYGKAEILTGAVAYISHLEETVESLSGEVVALKTRVTAFEKLAMSGPIATSNHPSPRALALETLQTVQIDFDHTKGTETKVPAKQFRGSRQSKQFRGTRQSKQTAVRPGCSNG